MHARIAQLQELLGLSPGGLLKLARDISGNGALVSLAHMRSADLEALCAFLEKVAESETVAA